jgi:hypothetical protein
MIKNYEAFKAGTLELRDLAECNNTLGKVGSTVKLQMAYSALRKEVPSIAFLNVGESVAK